METVFEVSGENDSLLQSEYGRKKSVNSVDSEVYHSASSRLTATGATMTSASGKWDSALKEERKSGFVSFNPCALFMLFRNAKILTVEPVIFLYMFGTYLYFPLYQQYFFNQFAIQEIRNSSELPNATYYCLSSNETDKYGGNGTSTKVEALSSYLNIYISLANQIPSIIFTLLYGPLSDRFGRRPVLMIVALGAIIQGLLSLAVVYWNWSVYLFILTSAVSGVCGDFAAVLMASFAYISDISSAKWLTFRIGLAEAMLFMAGALAEGTGGLWFQTLSCNFLPPIALYIGCNALLMAYVLLFLPESLSRKERERRALGKPKGIRSLIRGFKIYLCQIQEYSVWMLWAALIAIFVLVMTSAGSQRIQISFFKSNKPFDWDPTTIGYYQMTAQLSHMFGLLLILPILVALKLPDALISIIGLGFNVGMNIFTGLAKKTFEMFISKFVLPAVALAIVLQTNSSTHVTMFYHCAVGVIQGVEAIAFPPLRSIQSKAVDKADQGEL